MESQGAGKNTNVAVENSEATIEIKVKTLDSQTYSLRVDKQMPVPALKEQIASVTGVLSEQQRLICRGKVLKDDQLLSAYHVEDGHTLHLVVRQPIPPFENLANHPGNDPVSSSTRGLSGRMGPSMVIETFTMPEQGDGLPTEISRIVSAVLGSFGLPNIGGGIEGSDYTRDRGMQTEHGVGRNAPERSPNSFGMPGSVPFGPMHPPVVTDSLTTMFQYLSHLRHEFTASESSGNRGGEASAVNMSNSSRQSGVSQERLPTPVSLAEVLLSTRQFLSEEVAEGLLQLGRQLENHSNITDPAIRLTTQSSALRTGFQLYNLGAFLLELGRSVMTLRLGQAASEAVVNAGPAVFINSSSPNPLMVQPLPFQWAPGFSNSAVGSLPASGSGSVINSGFLPRRIDIQIRRGPSTVAATDGRRENGDAQPQPEPRHASTVISSENNGNQMGSRVPDDSSLNDLNVRVVPIRTVVAALPASFSRLQQNSSNSMGLYYPFLGRFQNVASGHVSAGNTSLLSGEELTGVQIEQHMVPERESQMNNIEQRIRDAIGRLSDISQSEDVVNEQELVSDENASAIQHESQSATAVTDHPRRSSSTTHPSPCDVTGEPCITTNLMSDVVTDNDEERNESVPRNSLFRFLSNLLSEGEMQVDEVAAETSANAVADSQEPDLSSRQTNLDQGVINEGLFISNLLRHILPVVTEHLSTTPTVEASQLHASDHQMSGDSSSQTENSVQVDPSHRHSNSDSDMPISKRQKME